MTAVNNSMKVDVAVCNFASKSWCCVYCMLLFCQVLCLISDNALFKFLWVYAFSGYKALHVGSILTNTFIICCPLF
jgi:hypothetical protein